MPVSRKRKNRGKGKGAQERRRRMNQRNEEIRIQRRLSTVDAGDVSLLAMSAMLASRRRP